MTPPGNDGDDGAKRPRAPRSDRGALRPGARDLALVLALFDCQAMSRGQIEREFFGSTARCNSRLAALARAGYVTRTHLPAPPGASPAGQQAVYLPGPAAVPWIARERELPLADVRKWCRPDRAPLFLLHALHVAEVRQALLRGLARRTDWRLDLWLGERDCRHEYDIRRADAGGPGARGAGAYRREVFRPDGFARLERTGRAPGDAATAPDGTGEYQCFFFEADLGNTSNRQWAGKFAEHRRYLESGLFAEVFGGTAFHTLVVTTTPRRRDNLVALAAEGGGGDLFRFATFADLATEEGPLARVWHAPGEADARRPVPDRG